MFVTRKTREKIRMSKRVFLFLFSIASLYGLFRIQLQEALGFNLLEKQFFEKSLPKSIAIRQDRMLKELGKREDLHRTQSEVYQQAFYENKFTHLPNIVILGTKKCGTKALLTFLLQHPKIRGCRDEFHWHASGEGFNHDFRSFLGTGIRISFQFRSNFTAIKRCMI